MWVINVLLIRLPAKKKATKGKKAAKEIIEESGFFCKGKKEPINIRDNERVQAKFILGERFDDLFIEIAFKHISKLKIGNTYKVSSPTKANPLKVAILLRNPLKIAKKINALINTSILRKGPKSMIINVNTIIHTIIVKPIRFIVESYTSLLFLVIRFDFIVLGLVII